ncbi:MAG: hypothetical protein ABSB70_24460 [Candidatus Velthaea sp.]
MIGLGFARPILRVWAYGFGSSSLDDPPKPQGVGAEGAHPSEAEGAHPSEAEGAHPVVVGRMGPADP